MVEEENLKKCPFCGAEAEIIIAAFKPPGVRCSGKQRCVSMVYDERHEYPNPVERWNRRVPDGGVFDRPTN